MMETTYITFILIAITCLVSYMGFQNNKLIDQLIFYPYEIKRRNQFYRFITNGFIHADGTHLLFNMFTLFFFGRHLEYTFKEIFNNDYIYPVFYLAALAFSSVPSYSKHKDNPQYRALGASGAVSAVLYATIIFNPWAMIYIKFIPMPAIIYAVGYVLYSAYMSKHSNDNIGHEAHYWGALFGFICPIVLKPELLSYFIQQLQNPHFNF